MKNIGKFYNFELKEDDDKSFYERVESERVDLTLAHLASRRDKEVREKPTGVLGFIKQVFNS